jgi:hypothetical protein
MTQGRAAAPCAAGGLGGLGLMVAGVFNLQETIRNHLDQLRTAALCVLISQFLEARVSFSRARLTKINRYRLRFGYRFLVHTLNCNQSS